MASAKPLSISPPKTKIEISAKSVVSDVIMVLDKVSFIEVLVISSIFELENLEALH